MKVLTDVVCGNDYTDAATITGVYPSSGGAFDVENEAVFCQLMFGPRQLSDTEWTQEIKKSTGTGYTIPAGCSGIRFRNATANQAATVNCAIAGGAEGAPSGGFPSAAASTMITGIIPAAGTAPTAGTGFTYTHTNGTGVYVFTFTSPFASAPTIVATLGPDTLVNLSAGRRVTVTAASPNGMTITVDNGAGAGEDHPFMFLATPTA